MLLLHFILQIKSAASNIPTCRAIIDSIGSFRPQHFGPLSSADLGSQAFEGGGCTHQGNNNWYQVMRPNDTEPSCDIAPPAASKWQRVCACTPYFLAQKGQSCRDACAENGYSCNLEKVTYLQNDIQCIINFCQHFPTNSDHRGSSGCADMQKHHQLYGI